jgi:hypothetical protein
LNEHSTHLTLNLWDSLVNDNVGFEGRCAIFLFGPFNYLILIHTPFPLMLLLWTRKKSLFMQLQTLAIYRTFTIWKTTINGKGQGNNILLFIASTFILICFHLRSLLLVGFKRKHKKSQWQQNVHFISTLSITYML